tara:strand:+ start:190 stop:561 length:372 start_codon:yes stop_codon:yes gene_type:complete
MLLETIMFFGCNSRLMTSSTVVFLTRLTLSVVVIGVYPVIRKCMRGVGIRLATRPIKSLFIYPGYLRVVVLAAITVLTNEFNWPTEGFGIRSRSTAIWLSAVLSRTTTASAFNVRRFNVKREL